MLQIRCRLSAQLWDGEDKCGGESVRVRGADEGVQYGRPKQIGNKLELKPVTWTR